MRPTCSSTAEVEHTAWPTTWFATFEVRPDKLFPDTKPSSLYCPEVEVYPPPLLHQYLANLFCQLASWGRWVEANAVCRSIPRRLPHHLCPSSLNLLPISRPEKWLFSAPARRQLPFKSEHSRLDHLFSISLVVSRSCHLLGELCQHRRLIVFPPQCDSRVSQPSDHFLR